MYRVGDRVIFEHPNPELDGLRGEVEAIQTVGVYAVRLDDGRVWERVWESKLQRESDYPDYPLPGAAQA